MRHGKKPTRAQKIRIGQAGLSPENWLVIRADKSDIVLVHKDLKHIRKIPAKAS